MSNKRHRSDKEQQSLYQDIERGVNHLKTCPECTQEYKEKQLDVIFEKGSVRVVHIVCDRCYHKVVSLVATTVFGMSSLGMTTDLSAEDFVRMAHLHSPKEDDLLDFHSFLHDEQQTFITLLSK